MGIENHVIILSQKFGFYNLIFDDILEDNTFKSHYLSFKYGENTWSTQYSTLKSHKIELLILLVPKPYDYYTFYLTTPKLLTISSTTTLP